jgi:hypothetical protein
MSASTPGNPNNFIQESFLFPENDPKEYDVKLRQYLNNMASSLNTKDNGLYTDEEVVTGQQFVPIYDTDKSSNLNYRDVFRKVIDFGALPNATTKNVAHGITTTEDFSIVKLYGTATQPGVSTIQTAIPIPYINAASAANSVTLSMDATNITIKTNTATYIVFTRCFVVVEYIKIV